MWAKHIAVVVMLSADVVGGAAYLALTPIAASASVQFMPCSNTGCEGQTDECYYEPGFKCGLEQVGPDDYVCNEYTC